MSGRDLIVEAAARVMLTQGLGRTTTKEIARAAGRSEAALYKHFRDKDELFLCVLEQRLAPLIDLMHDLPRRAGQGTVEANLEEVARVALAVYGETVAITSALFSEPDLQARYRDTLLARDAGPHRGLPIVAAYLSAEQTRGRLSPDADPASAAALLLGACFQRAFLKSFMGPATLPDADGAFARDITRTLIRTLSPA